MIFNRGDIKTSIIQAQHFIGVEDTASQFYNFNFYSEFFTMTKYFLGAEDSVLTINENNGNVYGATGIQTLKIKPGAANIKADANIEKFSFDNSFGSYKFQQTGINLKIFDNTDQLLN